MPWGPGRPALHRFGPLVRALTIVQRFASTDREGPDKRCFNWCFHAANPERRPDIGPRGLSPVAAHVVTSLRALVGSVLQTCNSRRDVCFRPSLVQVAQPSFLAVTKR